MNYHEGHAGEGEIAADRERFVVVAFKPLFDVEIEAVQPVILREEEGEGQGS